MRTKLTALAVLSAVAAAVVTVAAAGQVATKQRIAIRQKGGSFVLTPLRPGAIKADTGSASFCCWTRRKTMRNGEAIEIDDPRMTLTGKRGTLVARNRVGFVDIPDRWSVFTGTWKVISGTGQYAGLAGGGRGAGVLLPSGNDKARFEGFLAPK
jgi:hypothetical protein